MEGDDAISGGQDPIPDRFRVERVESTGSTNADVLARARDGEPEGLVLVADHQTAGRGRAGRTWTAPPGASLLTTILLRPPAEIAGLVTFAVAVAAHDAVRDVAGVRTAVKWPNDLIVEDGHRTRKLAGILAEAEWPAGSDHSSGYRQPAPDERATVAAGIGLNVNWPDDVPDDLVDIAVALNHLTDRTVTVDVVLGSLLAHLDQRYSSLLADGAGPLLDAWRERTSTLGRRVRVDLGSEDVVGVATDVTADGRLVVETDDGPRTLAVGDVVHLRPDAS